MTQNNLKFCIRKFTPQKRRAVAEVISSLLLVAITVVGAVILTTFLDESFISGGLTAAGSDSTTKTIKLIKYDSRDGSNLMGFNLNNTIPTDQSLCRNSCAANFDESPLTNGTEFIVIQVRNQSVNPIFLHNIWLSNATHSWDPNTASVPLDMTADTSFDGEYPNDGTFSILSEDVSDLMQKNDNEIESGQTVNLLIKLDTTNPDIALSKTIRAQFNIGANQLAEFLIESGGAQ